MPHIYETDGEAIYRRSFAIIRSEASLERFEPEEEPVVVRMIHAAGLVGLAAHVVFTPGMARAARVAPTAGARLGSTAGIRRWRQYRQFGLRHEPGPDDRPQLFLDQQIRLERLVLGQPTIHLVAGALVRVLATGPQPRLAIL